MKFKKRSLKGYIQKKIENLAEVEHAFVKPHSSKKGIIYATKKSEKYHVSYDKEILKNLYEKYGEYTTLHTHPSGNAKPSVRDILNLLSNEKQKTKIIIPVKKGKVIGYLIMRKTKKTPNIDCDNLYQELSEHKERGAKELYKYLIKKYCLQTRWVQNKESEHVLGKNAKKFLENRVLPSAIGLIFLSSIILSSLNITGYSILNLNQSKVDYISIILFIFGLIGSLIFFKTKKELKKLK